MARYELSSLPMPGLVHVESQRAKVDTVQQQEESYDSNRQATISNITAQESVYAATDIVSAPPARVPRLSRPRASFVIASIAGITILNTLSQSILTVGIPRIAADLQIPSDQIQWPSAIAPLTQGCTLLVVGAIADIVGNRPVFLVGCLLHLAFALGCALARNGSELIAFRALQGLALSFCMPTAVSIITSCFVPGRGRNLAFACFGGGNPLGYAVGLLLEGIFIDTIGWRAGFYLSVILNVIVLLAALFALPYDTPVQSSWGRLRSGVDWVGLALISAAIALVSYVLGATTTTASLSTSHPTVIALLTLALLLFPAFTIWVGRQEKIGRPALIPNSVWARSGFASVCLATFLTWAMFNAVAFNATLLIQQIQHVSALGTSLRFLPVVLVGVFSSLLAGYLVDKVTARTLLFIATLLSSTSPLLLAILSPSWSYWTAMFPAMFLLAFSSDFLFSISNLVITSTFPAGDQALAGGIFNTVSQLGGSIGLAVTSAISAAVARAATAAAATTAAQRDDHQQQSSEYDPQSMGELQGHRAAFWACFAAALASCLISTVGMRNTGKVGLKRD